MYWKYNEVIRNHQWINTINSDNFDELAIEVYQYQFTNNQLYQQFAKLIGKTPEKVKSIADIPFLPIHFFKTHIIKTDAFETDTIFESSGTTTTINSKHHIKDTSLYTQSFLQGFEMYYGKPDDFVFLCLLPSYLERNNSSLVYMAKELIAQSKHPESGFYLNEWEALANKIQEVQAQGKKCILLGVTFALIDFADAYPINMKDIIVMETGGMKGRKEEMTRKQVHKHLQLAWQLSEIHSEYGMTELLSQAYALQNGQFKPCNSMKVLVRSIEDPLEIKPVGKGVLNIIDLANVHSCSFIATDDLGNIHLDGSFEVNGRLDHAALRGCSLMAI